MPTRKRTCRVCAKPYYARGLCKLHYHRWYRHGDASMTHSTRRDARARSVYRFVRGYTAHHGFGPRIRDIAVALQLSPGQVHYTLEHLYTAGKLRRLGRRPRNIALPGQAPVALADLNSDEPTRERVCRFVARFQKQHGFMSTLQMVASAVGLRSRQAAHYWVRQCQSSQTPPSAEPAHPSSDRRAGPS
ncbi:MAG: hypothetical protein LC737_03530 [Chloroflexi bacterium]|nr:hypothetical protein [Chloroflexota bacterium]